MRNLCRASDELERRLQERGEPSAEHSVVLGYVGGAEICLMGWIDRPLAVDVRKAPTHANQRDSMQIVLSGGMELAEPTIRAPHFVVRAGERFRRCFDGFHIVYLGQHRAVRV